VKNIGSMALAQSYLRRQFVHQLLAQVLDWLAHGSEMASMCSNLRVSLHLQ
jgi:hypothetical protein